MALDIEKTYQAIVHAARERKFITYSEIAAASGEPWSKARHIVPQQLGRLLEISRARDWPYLSAIVVTSQNAVSGILDGSSLAGFINAVRGLGEIVEDPEAFVAEHQKRVFAWAPQAPDHLGPEKEASADDEAVGPRFVHYFGPLLDALREMGGEAKPQDVYDWVKSHVAITAAELDETNKSGRSKFENRMGWARFYLAKAELIDGRRRGLWVLTPKGRQARLDHGAALQIFRHIQARFQTSESENDDVEAPESIASTHELFDDASRQFWFVGAAWEQGDQTERFLAQRIWQNGYDDKFSDLVRRMKPGDKVAIKAAFVQKRNMPFDNRGKPVSCMRIKAVGTIIENLNDGQTVKVDWRRLDPARDWYFYTYRTTIVEADPKEELARRLILFTFADAKQDYTYWINEVPHFAKQYGDEAKPPTLEDILEEDRPEIEQEASAPTYTIVNIVDEGCFLPEAELHQAEGRLRDKKNLILQGPPGTGKTWLAKRLGYALIGSRDSRVTRGRLRSVQFHPSLSYEDFIRGWRPTGEGQLKLVDGLFLDIVNAAAAEPDRPYVLIIEEINRGNPAQIFGEMLTLLESSKRDAEEAIELAYRTNDYERIFIPKNLHIIGTMNIADRSLALVDFALRRRFAFVNLEPQFNARWQEWCVTRGRISPDVVDLVVRRMTALNETIANDRALGAQYRIGHSYVTPADGAVIADGRRWFRDIIETELVPLLEEYWFNSPERVQTASAALRDGL